MANTTTTLTAVADFSSLQTGFKQLEQGMSKSREGMQKFGSALGAVSSEMGGVGKAFGALGGIIASGSIFGAAAAAGMALISFLADLRKESEESAKAYKKMMSDIVDATKKGEDDLAKIKLKNAGGTAAMEYMRSEVAPQQAKVAQAQRGVEVYKEELKLWQDRKAVVDGIIQTETKSIEEARMKVAMYEAQLKNEKELLSVRQQIAQEMVTGEEQDAAKRAAEKAAEQAKTAGAKALGVQEAALKAANDMQKQSADNFEKWSEQKTVEASMKEFDIKIAAAKESGDQLKAVELELAKEIYRIKVEYHRKEMELRKLGPLTLEDESVLEINKAEDTANAIKEAGPSIRAATPTGEMMGPGSPLGEAEFQLASESQAKIRAEVAKTAQSYQQWGAIAGNVIGGIISGQMSIGQAFAQIGQMVIQTVVQSAISQITANAAVAGSGAAASQAAIPGIGPILAISAMGAVFSAVLGMLGKVGSAAGGWDLGSGGPFPAVLHAREMVLPAEHAETIRNLKNSSSVGASQIIINAVDAKSVERALLADDALLNVMRTFQRSGRM